MTNATLTPTRRFLGLIIGATLTAAALPVSAMERIEAQNLPRQISKASFQSLSAAELHEIDVAQKLGHQVLIGDYGPSQSRRVVDEALNTGRNGGVSRNAMTSDFFLGSSPQTR